MSHPDTYTNLSKSCTGRQFDPNTVVSAWLSISMVDPLLCEDVDASTLPNLMVQISATLIQLSTNSPQVMDWGVPWHTFLECLDFSRWVKVECFLLPSSFYDSSYSSLSEPGLTAVLMTDSCLFLFLTFFSSIAILEFHFLCPLLIPPPDLECPPELEAFFPPFIPLRALRNLSLSLLLSAFHSFES